MKITARLLLRMIFWAAMGFWAGCVVAPVPLIDTEVRHPWSGKDALGRGAAIEEQEKNWFLPVVASPEGGSKIPTSKSNYRYFWVRTENYWTAAVTKDRVELDFLKLERVGSASGWKFHGLPGTPYLSAERINSWGPQEHLAVPPEIVRLDIVVFEGPKLKHRRTLTSLNWQGTGGDNPVWSRFKYEADNRYIIYKSSDGLSRYDLWTDRDEPLSADAKSD